MNSYSNNMINSLPNTSTHEVFNSFEQCNSALYEIHNIDLEQYCEITHQIQFDAELIQYLPDKKTMWLRSVLNMLIQYARYDVRDFVIPVSNLHSIGINAYSHVSKIPTYIQRVLRIYDDNIKRELRFLKKNKLMENVDFTMITGSMDNEVIIIGYYITRISLYKLITRMYGSRFLESIISRMCQILYFFDDYKRTNRTKHIETLENTISKLNDDIESLRSSPPNIMKFDDYDRGSFKYYMDSSEEKSSPGNDIRIVHKRLSNSSSFSGYLSNQCNDKSDDICSIHCMIESSFEKMDSRLSEMHEQLSCVIDKINNIALTTAFSTRQSSTPSDSSDIFELNDDDNDSGLTKQYSKSFIAHTPPQCCSNMRNTCIGNEHQF